MTAIGLRPARWIDALWVWRQRNRSIHADLVPHRVGLREHWRWWRTHVADSRLCQLWILTDARGQRLGFVRFDRARDGRTMTVSMVMVSRYRNQGWGGLGLELALYQTRVLWPAVSRVEAYVRPDNVRAQMFWRRHRFVRDSLADHVFDGLCYTRSLTHAAGLSVSVSPSG